MEGRTNPKMEGRTNSKMEGGRTDSKMEGRTARQRFLSRSRIVRIQSGFKHGNFFKGLNDVVMTLH